MRTQLIGILGPLFLAFVAGCGSPPGDETLGSSADTISRSTLAGIALANVGKGACSQNSAGGYDFDSICSGNGGQPDPMRTSIDTMAGSGRRGNGGGNRGGRSGGGGGGYGGGARSNTPRSFSR